MSKPPFLKVVGSKENDSATPPEPPKTPEYVAAAARDAVEKQIADGIQTFLLLSENFSEDMNIDSFPDTYNMVEGYRSRLNTYMKGDDMIIDFDAEG